MTQIGLELIEMEDGGSHLLLHAIIGDQAIRLVLDTGASRTVLDSSFIESIFPTLLKKSEEEPSIGLGSNQLQAYTIEDLDLKIGDLLIAKPKLALMDLANVIQAYEIINKGPVHGVLGGDILLQYRATIDYEKLLLTLEVLHN